MNRLRAWLFKLTAYRIAVVIGLVFVVFHMSRAGRLDTVPVIGAVENIFHDMKFKYERGVRPVSGDVVVAAVDEKAITQIGRWPFERSRIAEIVDKITALGAKAIVFDVVYSDKAFEGAYAGAKQLRSQFSEVSLARQDASDMISRLSLAKTDASGAVEAAKALGEASTAARDVRTRLEPLSETLDTAVKILEHYKQLQIDYDTALGKATAGKSGDEALADSVHKSGRVVLGSMLLQASEEKQLTMDEARKAITAISHVRLPFPTVYPHELADGDELLRESEPIRGVKFRNFTAAKAPLEELMVGIDGGARTPLAFFNTTPDPDGVMRREPLILSLGDPETAPDQLLLVPSLDMGGILKFYDADHGQTRIWATSETSDQLEYVAVLKDSAKGIDGSPKMADFKRIPVDAKGRLLLNYYGPDGTFPNISIADIINNKVTQKLEGKIVLFGVTATGTFDQRVTPFDPISPGVEIHATALENILHDDYLVRPWWATVLELTILLAIALIVGGIFARVPVLSGVPVMLATVLAYHAFDYAMFRSGREVFSFVPIAEVMVIYVAQTIYRYRTEEKDKGKIRKAFQLYLQPSVIEEMLKSNELPKLGGEKRVLTVLFSDIRGFTTISEKLTPEQLAKLINEYLTPMTSLVFEHGGTLDKYIGDALMAIFGAPITQPDHALRCCRTAVHMMRELAKLQERWRLEGNNYPPIDVGIGINSGPMVVGNMGGNQRFDYTVLGDNVNLASRLEGTNKEYRSHIIISQSTYDMAKDEIACRELGAVRVKGKNEPVRIYELLDDKPATGDLAAMIALFNAGIGAFRAQQWDAARAKFNEVLATNPADGAALAYIDFVADYEKSPPGANWDGAYTMTHK